MSPQPSRAVRAGAARKPTIAPSRVNDGESARRSGVDQPLVLRLLACAFLIGAHFDKFVFSEVGMVQNASSVLGLALAVGFAFRSARSRPRIYHPSGFFILFILVTGLPRFLALALGRSMGEDELSYYLQYPQVVLLYVIVLDISRDPRALRGLAIAMIASTFTMSVLSHLGLQSLQVAKGDRTGLTGTNLNNQAFIYSQAVIGVGCWLLGNWPRFRHLEAILVLGAGSCVLALVQTGSRGGAASLLFGLALMLVVLFRKKRLGAYALLVPILVGGSLYALMTGEVLQDRVEKTIETGNTSLRYELFMASVDMFREHPLMGWGASYTQDLGDAVHRSHGRAVATHNTYTQVLVSFGILGSLPWALGIFASLRAAWRCRDDLWGPILFVLLASAMFAGLGMSLAYTKYVWLLLACVGGLYNYKKASGAMGPKRPAVVRVPAVGGRARPGLSAAR